MYYTIVRFIPYPSFLSPTQSATPSQKKLHSDLKRLNEIIITDNLDYATEMAKILFCQHRAPKVTGTCGLILQLKLTEECLQTLAANKKENTKELLKNEWFSLLGHRKTISQFTLQDKEAQTSYWKITGKDFMQIEQLIVPPIRYEAKLEAQINDALISSDHATEPKEHYYYPWIQSQDYSNTPINESTCRIM